MAEIVPLDDLQGHRLRMDPRMKPATIELLAGKDYQHSVRGSGPSINDAVADFMVNYEVWAARK